MRPQDLYTEIDPQLEQIKAIHESIAVFRAHTLMWSTENLRVDTDCAWTVEESHDAVTSSLHYCEEALSSAQAYLESAWSGLGRLASD